MTVHVSLSNVQDQHHRPAPGETTHWTSGAMARHIGSERKLTAAYHVCASSGMIPAPDEIGLMSISR
jgi:hypothetical protein